MLEFFRKYQRYFFLVVTVVIIISFSFFGTYSAISNDTYRDQIAFTAIDGTAIKRSDLDQLVLFIGTDADDKVQFGGIWGPNFLNDGVVKKDFIQTGLAELIAGQFPGEINQDLMSRHEKEKRFTPYTHPQAQFLSSVNAWSYMAPELKADFDNLRASDAITAPEAFAARLRLFQAEKKFPPQLLKQVLLYQQKQYNWLQPDPQLERADLSLFGYHTVEDWFGPRFMRLVAEFIINSSKIAEQQGYKVSKAEALADLVQNAESSFKQNLTNPNFSVANSVEYLNEQLHRMGLDEDKAASIWKQVVLFRRLFQDMGNSVFVDPFSIQKINQYAYETLQGDLYRLPKDMRISSLRDLQKFETYLSAISKKPEDSKNPLALPAKFLTPAEVAKQTPELVQKRYLLQITQTDKNLLSAKVSVKETWSWEVQDKNWEKLKLQFPELGTKPGDNQEQRYASLDDLEDKTRARVDAYARKEIVSEHPEWLERALDESEPKQITLSLKLKGGKTPIAGLENPADFMRLLDKAPLGEQDTSLAAYTADKNTYYRIKVLDRSKDKEILTFGEAQKEGVLDDLLEKKPNPDLSKELKAIKDDYAANAPSKNSPEQIIDEVAATLRFNAFMREALKQIKKDPQQADAFVAKPAEQEDENKLATRKPLADQWKLEKIDYHSNRSSETLNMNEAFALSPGEWTSVQTPVNGDLFFFQLSLKGTEADPQALDAKIGQVRKTLGDEAQKSLGSRLIVEMKNQNALSLDYLNTGTEMAPE